MADHRNTALALSWATVLYNVIEGIVAVVFAMLSGSPALLGFGIDSFVESLSGAVIIWRFSHRADDSREQTAIRLVGLSLIGLAVYVAYEAGTSLYLGKPPERNPVGLIIAAVSLVVMPLLYVFKRRTATTLKSRSLAIDAKQTLGCLLLSAALLIGNGLHYAVGLWQADPIVGLLIAAYLAREGYEAWKERELCC